MIKLGLNAWHDRLLEAVLFVVLSGAIFYVLKWVRAKGKKGTIKEKRFRYWFSAGNALLLTLFTIGCSGRYPLLLEEQISLFSELHRFKSQLHANQSTDVLLGNNRLLLVDVSHDMALIPDSSLNETWRANQLITDRQKLTQFLRSLDSKSDSALVDLVVCDLIFSEFSSTNSQDKALAASLRDLDRKGKLVMAQSSLDENRTAHDNTAINADAMTGGSVDITKYYDETFFSYKPIVEDAKGTKPSLPYFLYKRLNNLPGRGNPSCPPKRIVTKQTSRDPDVFIPDFWINNKDVSRAANTPWWVVLIEYIQGLFTKPDNTPDTPLLDEFSSQLRSSFFYLGQVTDTDTSKFGGRALFEDQLRGNYKDCKRNIVFIGIFEDPERDMHETLVGPMHGSVLLINLLLNLLAGSHQISFLYVIYLLVGFFFVSLLLFPSHWAHTHLHKSNKKTAKPNFIDFVREKGANLVQGLVEKRAYFVAFLWLLGAIALCNHLINIAVVGIYLLISSEIFDYLFPEKKRNKIEHTQRKDNTES